MFGGGGGGLDPRKMKQMMEQMGVSMDDIDAEEVVIRTPEYDLVFDDAEVQRMTAQGSETYQVVGEPEERPRDEGGAEGGAGGDASDGGDAGAGGDGDGDSGADAGGAIPQDDVDLVATRTGASEADAREALEATEGDLAAAVERLE